MRGRVSADPDRLEAYSSATLPLLPPVQGATNEYGRALTRLNEASSDVGGGYIDPSASIGAQLELLHELDRGPEALAFALRNLDEFRDARSGLSTARFGELDLLGALTSAYLSNPDASASVLVDAAADHIDRSWRMPWDDGVGAWLSGEAGSPSFWASTTIGAALGTVIQVDKLLVERVSGYTNRHGTQVADYERWKRGYAQRLNRISRASAVARVAPWARWGSRALPFAGAAGIRIYEDWNDPTLTAGDRIARVGSATVVEGGLALAGGTAGALLGGAALAWAAPPVGPIVGGVVGGAVGGFIGGQVGGMILDNFSGAIEGLGRFIDGTIDTMASVGTAVASGVNSVATGVGNVATAAGNVAVDAATSVASGVGPVVSGAGTVIADTATSVASGAANTVGSVASGVADGVGSVASGVADGAGAIASGAASTVSGWFGG